MDTPLLNIVVSKITKFLSFYDFGSDGSLIQGPQQENMDTVVFFSPNILEEKKPFKLGYFMQGKKLTINKL